MTQDLKHTLLNLDNTAWKDGRYSLILGQQLGLHDTINVSYPDIKEMYIKQKEIDWDEKEVNLSNDRLDMINRAPKHIVDLMVKNLMYQWEFDSIAAHSFLVILAPFISNPELWRTLLRFSDIECLTPDHEVLTTSGWKNITEITLNDKVANYDLDTQEIYFAKPTNVIKKHHEGVVYSFQGAHVDTVVTPNHRLPIVYPYEKGRRTNVKLAGDEYLYNSCNALPISGYKTKGSAEYQKLTALQKLYIAVQADGSLVSDKYTGERSGTIHYSFTLKKKRKVTRLLQICEELGFEVKARLSKKRDRHTYHVFVPVEYYRRDVKYSFDWIDLEHVTSNWVAEFIEELALWDGNKNNKQVRFCSTNKNLIDRLESLAPLAGYKAHLYVIPESTRLFSTDDGDKVELKVKEGYQLSFCKKEYTVGKSFTRTEELYSGDVYCLSVPSTFFVVRRNKKVTITGNCTHAATYSHIISNCLDDHRIIFEEIQNNEKIKGRMHTVERAFERLDHLSALKRLADYDDSIVLPSDQEMFNDVFKYLWAMYLAEGLQFTVSFAATFVCAEQGYFSGICALVQKIANDEVFCHAINLHKVFTHLLRDDPRAKIAMQQIGPELKTMLDEVIQNELTWAKYLFSEGRKAVGLNYELTQQYVKYRAHFVAKTLGFNETEMPPPNPLKFMDRWLDIDAFQVALQETDGTNYKKVHYVESLEQPRSLSEAILSGNFD